MNTFGNLVGTPEQLARIQDSQAYLFDLDDTVALYDHDFTASVMTRALINHAIDLAEVSAQDTAKTLASLTHYGHGQTGILEGILGPKTGHGPYWDEFLEQFNIGLQPEHIRFDPHTIAMIARLIKAKKEVGIISNNSVVGGNRVVQLMAEQTGIDLTKKSIFLGHEEGRKPEPEALDAYRELTGSDVDTARASYFGNTVSDVMFAENTGMQAVVIDYNMIFGKTEYCDRHRPVITRAVITSSFGHLDEHLSK